MGVCLVGTAVADTVAVDTVGPGSGCCIHTERSDLEGESSIIQLVEFITTEYGGHTPGLPLG